MPVTRSPCPRELRPALLHDQEYRCAYCGFLFGTVVATRARNRLTTLEFDHFTPLAYCQSNARSNWVAACNICNNIKNDKMFKTLADAKLYLMEIWEERGYHVVWDPPSSSEAPPPGNEKWAVSYATYLGTLARRDDDATGAGQGALHRPRGSNDSGVVLADDLPTLGVRPAHRQKSRTAVADKRQVPQAVPRLRRDMKARLTLRQLFEMSGLDPDSGEVTRLPD